MSFVEDHSESVTDERRTWPDRYNAMLEALDNATPRAHDDVVTDAEATTSTSYTDLSAVGPEVTFDLPEGGAFGIVVRSTLRNSDANHASHMAFEIAGPQSVAAGDARSLAAIGGSSSDGRGFAMSWSRVLTGFAAGEYTITAKYRVTGGEGRFWHRGLSVVVYP